MTRWVVLALLGVGLATGARAEAVLEGLDGQGVSAEELAAGRHVLVVWASWSPRCRDVVERVNALVERWSSEASVGLVNFQEDPETVRAFLAEHRSRARVFLDQRGTFSKRHRVTTLPGLLVLDEGEVTYRGPLPHDPDEAIRRALD